MTRPGRLVALASFAVLLSGCSLFARKPAKSPVETPAANDSTSQQAPADAGDTEMPERNSDLPPVGTESVPPCLPEGVKPKPVPRRKPKPVTVPHPEPPPEPPTPVASTTVAEPQVRSAPVTSVTVLGRKVQGPKGEDMGRVVDVLVDSSGQTRIAIIEFGGFLGVGNRRIAVDWSLLKFKAEDAAAPLILNATKERLLAAPDYKDTYARPPVLMAPSSPEAEGRK
jgi:hypothetical protein